MPSFVITDKCDGCQGQDKTACMYICPHDLMALKKVEDKDTNEVQMKGVNQEPVQCWECYSCVKICPQQAIEIRCYADFAPLGGSVFQCLDLTASCGPSNSVTEKLSVLNFPPVQLILEKSIFLQVKVKHRQIFQESKNRDFSLTRLKREHFLFPHN